MIYFLLACFIFQLWLFVKGKFNLGYGLFAGVVARATIAISFVLQIAVYIAMRHHHSAAYIIPIQIVIFFAFPWLELRLGIVKMGPKSLKKHV